MDTEGKWVMAHCNSCGQLTKHDVVAVRRHNHSEACGPNDEYEVSWGDTYTMLECRGCEEISMKRTRWCSEDWPDDPADPGVFFPPRVSRREPDWMVRFEIPKEYDQLLREVYVALHADSRRLAMMGARALLDVIIQRQAGDAGSFEAGLNQLVKRYFINEVEKSVIKAAVDVGHASAHRGHQASEDDANTVIDIVESLIHKELLAAQVPKLRSNTPKRSRNGAADMN